MVFLKLIDGGQHQVEFLSENFNGGSCKMVYRITNNHFCRFWKLRKWLLTPFPTPHLVRFWIVVVDLFPARWCHSHLWSHLWEVEEKEGDQRRYPISIYAWLVLEILTSPNLQRCHHDGPSDRGTSHPCGTVARFNLFAVSIVIFHTAKCSMARNET